MTPPPAPLDEGSVPERFRVDLDGRTLLDTYRVESKLAEGGMGSIYLARDTSLDQPVVVKVPHARFLAEPGFRVRLAREITELVRLEHPHVVRILARGEVDDIPFFVLQFLGGGSLEDKLVASRVQTPEDTLDWLPEMARTLDFVHKRGILHRDVKPGNILFDEEGHVFLSDFGVAKAVGAESDALTGTGVGIGSPKYMAPEQALGREVGPPTDQYGLASTLYEALAGDVPFHGTPVEILVRKSREDAPSIRDHVADLPEAAAEALMRAMARDPAERFPSCEAFAQAFATGVRPAADTTQAVQIPQPTPTETELPVAARRQGRRRLLLNLLAIGLGIAALATLLSPGDDGPAPTPPSARPRRSLAEIELLDTGRTPRQVLRYDVQAGSREPLAMTLSTAEWIDIPSLDRMESFGPIVTLDSDLHVERIDEDGDLLFVWTPTRCTIRALGDEDAAEVPIELDGFAIRGQAEVGGVVHDVTFDEPDEATAQRRKLFEGFRMVVNELATPLPTEPIGVGARWAVARTTTQMGMRMVETSEFELLEIEGRHLLLGVKTALTAPEQTVELPATPEGLEFTLISLHGRGTSRIRLDLDQLAPTGLASRIEGAFTMSSNLEIPDASSMLKGAFRKGVEMFRGATSERR